MKAPKLRTNLISKIILCLFLITTFTLIGYAQQLSFPTAKGAGAYATGGRGGQVIHVTTLDWDAPGGLKEALQTTGARTIVFDVSGTIDATQEGWFSAVIQGSQYSNFTIAGQSAPEGGITILTSDFRILDVDNFIIRFVRFRHLDGVNGASAFTMRGCSNYILDHLSGSHGNDETIDAHTSNSQTGDVTFQNCLYSNSPKGGILGSDTRGEANPGPDLGDFTYINNVFCNVSHRFPNAQGNGRYDIINNVIYNWKNRLVRITQGGEYNILNNYNKPSNGGLRLPEWYGNGVITNLHKIQAKTNNLPVIHASGNIVTGQRETAQSNDSDMFRYFAGSDVQYPIEAQAGEEFFTSSMFPLVGETFTIKTANEVYQDLIDNGDVGAYKTLNADGSFTIYRDSNDTNSLNELITDSFVPRSDYVVMGEFYHPSSFYAYPTIPENNRPSNFYQSNPHIPEVWFTANVPSGQDHNDIAPSGYTWLEEYLNQVDNTTPIPVINVTGVDVTPETAEILIPDTITLTATITPNDATDQSGLWTSSDEAIATVDASGIVTPVTVGEVIITFTTNDGGYSDTSVITVFPEAFEANAGLDQTICQGESIVLSASGGITYLWSNGEATASIEVSPTVTTTYTVTAFDDLGNSDDDTVTVTVNELPIAEAGDDQTICEGDTVTLTASGGNQYLWSTGETTASISVAPTSDTVYTVEVTTNGCSSVDDVNVFVNSLPNIDVSNDVTIMDGETTTLTVSGSDNYLWSTGETTESIDVTPSVTTTYTVTSASVNGCTSNREVTVTVVPELIADAGEDVEICNGEETVLAASGGVNYTWNTGETSAQITVSPNTTTTYTVTVEDAFGNSDSDSVTVTVNDSPTLNITEDLTIVEGESIQLTVSGASTYAWSTGETSNTINVSPNETTTYTVIGTTATCSTEAQVTVTVEELLVVSAGQDENVCENDTYEVVLTASSGDSYLWSTGETTQSIIVSPLSTTTYTVTVTSGIQEDTDDVTVFVNPNPDVVILNGESVDIMSGDFVTLSASGANTYEWNNGATQPNIAVSPSQTTTYEVRGYIGDCYDEKQVTVNVIPEVEADAGEDQEICLGDVVTLTANGGDEYVWSTGETTQSIQVSPTETTEYTVTVFNALDFDEDTVTVFVDSNCTDDGGVVEDPIDGTELDFEFSVFPNPATEFVDIKLSGSDQLTGFYIYDITGKLILQKRVENESLSVSSTTRIDVSSFRPGIYLIKLADIRRELYKKLIVR